MYLYSWDTFRTFYPLMALTSPVEFSQIVDSYIDAWRVHGFLPECRANHLRGWTQGGMLVLCIFWCVAEISGQARVAMLLWGTSP